jgi:hypothetical protein
MRLVIVVLVLMLCAIARAEDDEGVLDTPPLGGIPERMDVLEREWQEDVGTKDPVEPAPETAADADEKQEDGLAVPEFDEDELPAPRPVEELVPAKSAAPARPSAVPAPREKSTADAPVAKPPARAPTTPDD